MTRSPAATAAVALSILAGLTLAGCGESDDLGPPTIVYAQTECDRCKMIISEEPFAAAAVFKAADGRVCKPAFDDIGCLLEFLGEIPASQPVTCYVHDHQSRKWIDATHATFVRSDALQTPMASRLAACGSSSAADELLRRYPGTTIDFERLRAAALISSTATAPIPERSNP